MVVFHLPVVRVKSKDASLFKGCSTVLCEQPIPFYADVLYGKYGPAEIFAVDR